MDLEERMKVKLLLLGAGESGKSTIFKQMKILYGEGFGEDERRGLTDVVYRNVILGTKILCQNATIMAVDLGDAQDMATDFLMNVDSRGDVDGDLGAKIKALWALPGIQEVYDRRAEFQLFDSYSVFANNIDRIAADGYIPSVQDVLCSRLRTTGIVEEKYKIRKTTFMIYDVGGQRSERRKWIHCFEGVTAIIFVAAISAYDQVLLEDKDTNRMEEALNLFEEIANSRWFLKVSIILFLNKRDLFEEKFYKVPFRCREGEHGCIQDRNLNYNGGNDDIKAAKEFVVSSFKARAAASMEAEDKQVYHHITCATDSSNVEIVFNACFDIILSRNLKAGGMLLG